MQQQLVVLTSAHNSLFYFKKRAASLHRTNEPNSMENSSLKRYQFLGKSTNSHGLRKRDVQCRLQKHPTSPPYPEPYQSTPCLTIIFTIHFNIIVSCASMSFKWSLFFSFPTENFNALLIAPKSAASQTT